MNRHDRDVYTKGTKHRVLDRFLRIEQMVDVSGDVLATRPDCAPSIKGVLDRTTQEILELLTDEGYVMRIRDGYRLTDAGRAALEWGKEFQARWEFEQKAGGGP